MQVHCDNTDCRFLNASFTCTKNMLWLDDEGACLDFKHFNTLKEYKEPYYIAVTMANDEKGKALKYGKKIVINGYTFFTCENYEIYGEECNITEERTGYLCDSISRVKNNFSKFLGLEQILPSCASLPLCEYDKKIKGYIPKEEGGAGNDNG